MPRKTGESADTYARRLVSEANTRNGEGHHRVAEELLVEAGQVAAGLSSSKAMRVHSYADQVRDLLPDVQRDQALLGAFRDAVLEVMAGQKREQEVTSAH